jgi:hypothetical protein
LFVLFVVSRRENPQSDWRWAKAFECTWYPIIQGIGLW